MSRRMSRASSARRGALGILAVVLVALLAACGASATARSTATATATAIATATHMPTATATAIASAPPCTAAQLTAAIARSGVAAGNVGTWVSLENSSRQACSLDGYPGLLLLDAGGHALPTHVTDATSAFVFTNLEPSMIVVAPGARAYFVLSWTYNPCANPPTSAALQITPPGAAGTVTATVQLDPCDGKLTTSPIVTDQ